MSALDSAGVSAAAIPHTGGEEQSIKHHEIAWRRAVLVTAVL
jgi:hypothetical protein